VDFVANFAGFQMDYDKKFYLQSTRENIFKVLYPPPSPVDFRAFGSR